VQPDLVALEAAVLDRVAVGVAGLARGAVLAGDPAVLDPGHAEAVARDIVDGRALLPGGTIQRVGTPLDAEAVGGIVGHL